MPGITPRITPFETGPEAPAEAHAVSAAVRQQEMLQPGRYMLRHIARKTTEAGGEGGVINPFGPGFLVLAQTLYAEPLPVSRLPDSPDFHEGKYTLRMLDAGDFELSMPNKDASDGRPWRERFSTAGHSEFIEISREGEIETIGVIVKQEKNREKITISGYDAFFLLKKSYEQEWTGVMAPRDLIERHSQLYVVSVAEDFPGNTLSSDWVNESAGSGTATVGNQLILEAGQHGHLSEGAIRATSTFTSARLGPWSIRAEINITSLTPTTKLQLAASAVGSAATLTVENAQATLGIGSTAPTVATALTLVPGPHTMLLECDGRWVSAYWDGGLIGYVGAFAPESEPLVFISAGMNEAISTHAFTRVLVSQIVCKSLEPFLMRGAEKGDYVLPGEASTYPTGGLHGRFIVQGETGGGEAWWNNILAPDPRRSGFPEYVQEQNETIDNPKPDSIPEHYWAARWFGAVWLDLETTPKVKFSIAALSGGARLWVGKTQFGQQIIDSWTEAGSREVTGTATAAALGARAGWFPLILEFFVGADAAGIELYFEPEGGPGWTDPGGAVIANGTAKIIPASSLSPLGCVDARIQGSSFFDLVQETAKNTGYQLRCEARQLESGEFPGRIVPKARIGKETDELIEPDDLDRKSGMNNYTQTLDATDSANSVKAFGSGIADGKGSQISFEAMSLPDEEVALFDMQSWCSAGDIAFPELLAARAQAELELRRGSWENVEGEPLARDRLADTFPLSGVLSQFHWQPGDGVRLWLPDVGVQDTVPRPIMQVVRQIQPEGRVGTQIGFRARPKDPLYAMRTALREATRPARAYQHQYVSRHSEYATGEIAAGGFSPYLHIPLGAEEKLVSAIVFIAYNASGRKAGIEINGVLRTTALDGPWTATTGAQVNVLPYCSPASEGPRVFVRLKNESAEGGVIEGQLVLTLLV